MRTTALSVLLLVLFVTSAAAADRYVNRRWKFSFPIPAGWTEASPAILGEEYEQMDEGIDGIPETLTAYEKNPSKRRTEPTVVVRFNRMKPAEMTAWFERLKTDEKGELARIVADRQYPSVYKIGRTSFDARTATVRIPHRYESWSEDPIQLITVLKLGQYSLITLEIRAEKKLYEKSEKDIEALITGFAWERRFRLGYTAPAPEPDVPAPPPPANRDVEPLKSPDPEPEAGLTSGVVLAVMGGLLLIGVLALVVVKASGGREPPRRGRGGGGGGGRRRR